MVEPELVKFQVSQTNCNYTHPFTQLALLAKGGFNKDASMARWS